MNENNSQRIEKRTSVYDLKSAHCTPQAAPTHKHLKLLWCQTVQVNTEYITAHPST